MFHQGVISKEAYVILPGETLLTRYLHSHMFTELHLDGIYKYGDDNTLPPEVCCVHLLNCLIEKF